MITLYGFGRVPRPVMGVTRDLRVRWGLEELGLPYRVQPLDHPAGELDSPAYDRISWFHQVPVIDDEGFIVAESAAILLYLAEKAGKLIPPDFEGRTRVVQWCFAAVATVELPLTQILNIELSGGDPHGRRPEPRTRAAC
jgi:glutathione S-transferase